MRKYVKIALGIFILVVSWNVFTQSFNAMNTPDFEWQWNRLYGPTKLKLFENPILGIAEEIHRQSPDFRKNQREYIACMEQIGCDPAATLGRLDAAIKLAWQETFDRLLYEQDWGTNPNTLVQKHDFFRYLRLYGLDLRNAYFPRIEFKRNDLGEYKYIYKGYRPYSSNTSSTHAGGVFIS